MKRNKFRYLLLLMAGLVAFTACSDSEKEDPSQYALPQVKFAYDGELVADLNKIDNLPLVATATAEAGLSQVRMQIERAAGLMDYKTVTDFFNPKSYGIAEYLTYEEDYVAFVVTAVDKFGREKQEKLPFGIIELKEAPKIEFNPEEIYYDETVPGAVMPETHFTVTSRAGLSKVETFIVSAGDQRVYSSEDLDGGELTYTFTDRVMYQEGDRFFKVVATDVYEQVNIQTIPVTYVSVAPPVITMSSEPIIAAKNEVKNVSFSVEAESGVSAVKIYRMEGSGRVLEHNISKSGEKQLNVSEAVTFTNATTAVLVEVVDMLGKEASAQRQAVVNLRYKSGIGMVSHFMSNGHDNYPGAYPFLSVKDLTTYSLNHALASASNAANIDIKFYVFSKDTPRFYSIDGDKNSEFAASGEFAGKNAGNLETKNMTRMYKMPDGFDFDNATAESISSISSALITASMINPFAAGDVIAFRTGSSSSAGGGVIGLLKVEKLVQIQDARIYIEVAVKVPAE